MIAIVNKFGFLDFRARPFRCRLVFLSTNDLDLTSHFSLRFGPVSFFQGTACAWPPAFLAAQRAAASLFSRASSSSPSPSPFSSSFSSSSSPSSFLSASSSPASSCPTCCSSVTSEFDPYSFFSVDQALKRIQLALVDPLFLGLFLLLWLSLSKKRQLSAQCNMEMVACCKAQLSS